jgi:signal transduction histidine kinase
MALVIAYTSFPLLTRLAYRILEATVASPEAIQETEEQYIWLLQEYLVDNTIKLSNLDAVYQWVAAEPDIKLTLFNNNMIFDSDYENMIYNDYNDDNIAGENESTNELRYDSATTVQDNLIGSYNQYLNKQYISTLIKEYNSNFYTLTFADGAVVSALVRSESYSQYYLWAYYICLIVSLIIFLIISLLMVQIKLRYIHTLSRELRILEGGDLNYEMTEAGQDELYELAKGINQMRLSILAKKHDEEKTKEANQKLMTALAHDLRTPLTSLIGYLELMLLKRYQDEDQLKHFLMTTKRKAFQIREMSDKLFEYFLASEKTEETYNKEIISTHTLITSLIDNQLFDLESSGFPVKLYAEIDSFKGNCLIDAEFLQRVLDNTLSNIRKYADRNRPLDILAFETDAFLHIEFVNFFHREAYAVESTALGLRTCVKIMQEHGGSYQGYETDDKFVSRLILPLHHDQ